MVRYEYGMYLDQKNVFEFYITMVIYIGNIVFKVCCNFLMRFFLFYYLGAVKDIQWDRNRNNILSGGYDKIVKLTDIETGTAIQVSYLLNFKHFKFSYIIYY